VLTAGVHRLRVSGCIPGALDLFGVLTATELAARSSMRRLSCQLLNATVPLDTVLSRSATAKVGLSGS